ncbi:hypothetical protein MPSEU_000367800 [Mayamaea pseudoterrestris]|nr:hypothetical protein MPSEU_000367800 [Mayamaea pseudoterrestris]
MSGAGSKLGSKLVVVAVGGTLAALGIGTIYLPFFADKDKVRGLHEESELSFAERAEYERVMREIKASEDDHEQQQKRGGLPSSSNSMWSRINQAASGQPK